MLDADFENYKEAKEYVVAEKYDRSELEELVAEYFMYRVNVESLDRWTHEEATKTLVKDVWRYWKDKEENTC